MTTTPTLAELKEAHAAALSAYLLAAAAHRDAWAAARTALDDAAAARLSAWTAYRAATAAWHGAALKQEQPQ